MTYDATPPGLTIENAPAGVNSTAGFSVTFTFSEPVTDFTSDDIAVTNATVSGFSGTGGSYTATITPTGAGTVTIDVAAAAAQDAAGNDSTAAAQVSVAYDATPPTVELRDAPAQANGDGFTVTLAFSEAVTGLTADDIAVTNAAVSNLVAVDATTWTATVTPDGSGDVTIDLAAGAVRDLADNPNGAATQVVVTYDGTVPTVAIQGAPAIVNTAAPIAVTFAFSEDVTGFDGADVTLANATLSNFAAVDAANYTADVTPTGGGDVTIDVAASAASDAAGSGNTAATQVSVTYDATAPTLAIGGVPSIVNSTAPFTATFTFSEPVTGFTSDDITVANATVSGFTGSGSSYSATITPTGAGNATIDVAGGAARDAAGNDSTAATQAGVTYDATAPTVEIRDAPASANDTAFSVTFVFSEEVTGFTIEDITVGNATVSDFVTVDGTTYTATITPDGDGDVSVSVAAGVAQDLAGNDNDAASQVAVTYDTTAPGVAIQGAPVIVNSTDAFSVTIVFSEAVTGFDAADITVTNAAVSDLASADGVTWTADITPDGAGGITIDVAAGVARDAAGNDNTAAEQVSVQYDDVAPTVTLDGPTGVVTEPFTVTFTFSEPVTGFAAADIAVQNGSAGTVSGSGSAYSVEITPVLGATVTITVPAGSASDAAGNGNLVSAPFTVQAGSPASEFARFAPEIRRVITDEAERALRGTLAVNRRMVREARGRFTDEAARQAACADPRGIERIMLGADGVDDCPADTVSRGNVPFDVDGTATVDGLSLRSNGSFFGQTTRLDGGTRRLVFGDFDVQHDGDTGSTTLSLTGRMAWERMVSDRTLLGAFVGAEVAYSSLDGAFEGSHRRLGVTLGGYAVHALRDNLLADGFLTFGAGHNALDMANAVLGLESGYGSRMLTFGGALSGVIDRGRYQVLPELAVSYGHSRIGEVGFTGRAYGLVDDTLRLDIGSVSMADVTFRPEVRLALDGLAVGESLHLVSLAPRVVCRWIRAGTTTGACGGGAELGIAGRSANGLTTYDARIVADRVGGRTSTSVQLGVQHRF